MSYVIATGARYLEMYFSEKFGRDVGAPGNGWVRDPLDATHFATEAEASEYLEARLPFQAPECRVLRHELVVDNTPAHLHELGLIAGASTDEIRAAYRRLAMQHHPDRNQQDPAASERFQRIKAAYEALTASP